MMLIGIAHELAVSHQSNRLSEAEQARLVRMTETTPTNPNQKRSLSFRLRRQVIQKTAYRIINLIPRQIYKSI